MAVPVLSWNEQHWPHGYVKPAVCWHRSVMPWGVTYDKLKKIHTDDMPVPVLEPGRGKTRTGRLWTYVRDDRPAASRAPPAVWDQYSPDRRSARPQKHQQGFSGILQADAYNGDNTLYRSDQIVEASCWAHARSKFYDVFKKEYSPTAQQALACIGALYGIERQIRGCAVAFRQSARQQQAIGLLANLKAWLDQVPTTVSAKSGQAKAIRYTLGHWVALTRYCDDGRIEIDKNTAEPSIRRGSWQAQLSVCRLRWWWT